MIFRFDEPLRLKVPYIAKPAARITWFFDDEPIAATEDVQIETTDTQTTLKISAAKRWHCGEFRKRVIFSLFFIFFDIFGLFSCPNVKKF